MPMFNGDYSNSGTEWSPRGARYGYSGGGWGRGRGRGSGGRWASPRGGRGPYDHPRPPPLPSREGVWGTGDGRHSDRLVPGSSLVDESPSNRHSSGTSGGSTSSTRRGRRGSGEGGEGGVSSSPSTGRKKRTPESVNHNDSSSNSGNYKRQRNHSGSPGGGRDGGERKIVPGRGDGDESNKSPGSSNNNDNSNYDSNNMKLNKLGRRRNGSRGKSGQRDEESIVLQRREAKLKELQRLDYRKKVAVAAGEALAKDVQRNRMEQEEIAIQIDAVKRFLALYDSTFASSEDPIAARTQKPPSSANAGAVADGDSEVARLPPPSVPPPGTLQTPPPPAPQASPPMPTAYVRAPSPAVPEPLEESPSRSSSPFASRPRSEPSARGRGGSSARGRVPGSRSSLVVAGDSIAVGDMNPNDPANAGSARAGIVPGAGLGVAAGAAVEARSKGAKKGSGHLAGRCRKPGGNSSSSSSDDDDASGVPGGVGGNGNTSSLYGYIMSMPPSGGGTGVSAGALAVPEWSVSKPQAGEADVEVFPNRVLSDGTKDGARNGSGSGGNGGPMRGKEANMGSFHIQKQLMFRTTRTKKARSMAFNPAVPGLFAVCSADLSVDIWQYTRKNNELERVWARQEATPVGGAHMAWNPSGTHLAIGHTGNNLVNKWAATIVGRGDAFKGMKLRSDKHTKSASAVAWVTPSKNNQDHLVTGGEDGRVVIWTRVLDATSDLHKVAVLHTKHTSGVKSTCCPSISPTVVSGGSDGRLVSFSIETASVEWEEALLVSNTYHPHVNELLEFPDSPRCLLVSAVDTARSHSMFTMDTREKTALIHSARRMTWKRKDEKKPFSTLVYPSISPCGRYVACAGDWNGCFHLWDVRSGRAEPMQSVLVNSLARVKHTAWHPDPEVRAIMSLSNAPLSKNFALHLHGGLRS